MSAAGATQPGHHRLGFQTTRLISYRWEGNDFRGSAIASTFQKTRSAFLVTNLAPVTEKTTLQAVHNSLWTRLTTGKEEAIKVAAG